jgi:alkanesulfonate monooxygenase SsuD/methylene tetrahydromethanopterin reductase-like flavin-dependent oxidoreductase (luciferase family)
LIEEICMLDQLSGGRLEIGFGRGSSAIEIGFYGQEPANAQRIYTEALDLVLRGLSEKRLDFHGEFFSFDNVPLEIAPLQKPHPPVWYGVHSVESAERAARRALNVVSLDSARETRSFADRYRQVRRELGAGAATMPKIGISRFIVIADTDQEALGTARRAYPIWHRSFYHLFKLYGGGPAHPRPNDFDSIIRTGQGIAGSPETVDSFLKSQLEESGANYLVGQFAFGDLSLNESLRSVDLFAERIMPKLKSPHGELTAD